MRSLAATDTLDIPSSIDHERLEKATKEGSKEALMERILKEREKKHILMFSPNVTTPTGF